MPKCSLLLNKLLQLKLSTCIFTIICLIAIINFFTYYGCYNYKHIPHNDIKQHLYKVVNPKLVVHNSKPVCKYDHVLQSSKSTSPSQVPKKFNYFAADNLANGTFVPEHCNPQFSVAILVTYRNRQKQLDVFLPYIHNFLRKQNIHYRIYLIEQQDESPWNKGKLYNIGAKQAIADEFPCLILHDVDLLPLDENNLYVCTEQPRHISASLDKFRYILTYDYLVGGVLAIRSSHYELVNGFSNNFEGWGGEDDDFAARLTHYKLNVVRFPPEMSRYTMLVHRQENKNSKRLRIMADNKLHFSEDGLNSVKSRGVTVKKHRLFTMIGVKL